MRPLVSMLYTNGSGSFGEVALNVVQVFDSHRKVIRYVAGGDSVAIKCFKHEPRERGTSACHGNPMMWCEARLSIGEVLCVLRCELPSFGAIVLFCGEMEH